MERISRIMVLKADSRQDVDEVFSGDIFALVGVREVVTGDTLCEREMDIRLEPPSFPEPVISLSIEPKTVADQEKLAIGLQRLSEEDPTFMVKIDPETGQTLIAGMGELHLEIIRDRLRREFKVMADSGRPMIAYRETVKDTARGRRQVHSAIGRKGAVWPYCHHH
jgi:elongation factor G